MSVPLAALDDLGRAFQSLRRRPAHSLHVISALALGIGAFAGLLAYLSYFKRPRIEAPSPAEIAWVFRSTPEDPRAWLSQPDFLDLERAQVPAIAGLAGWRGFGASVRSPQRTVHGWGHAVSGGFFDLFGATPFMGRLLGPADDRRGAEPVLVASHRFWRVHLGADPHVIGTEVLLDGRHRYTVVGVTQPRFQGPALGMSLYVPLATAGTLLPAAAARDVGTVSILARRAGSASPAQLSAALAAVASGLDDSAPLGEARRLEAIGVHDYVAWAADDPLVRGAEVLTLTVGCLLLLACANIANLMLAGVIARLRDLAVQAAIGAGRLRLGRQMFFESLLLALAGGLLGLPLVRPVLALIEKYLVDTVPVGMGEWAHDSHLVIDMWMVGGASVILMLAIAGVTAIAPALMVARQDLLSSLRSDAVSGALGRLAGRRLLVVGQVALSVVLLTGTGLFVQTLRTAGGAPLGFEPAGRTLATLHVPPGTAEGTTPAALFGAILDDVRGLAGVRAASLVARVPGGGQSAELRVAGAGGDIQRVGSNVIADGYFDSLGIPLRDGRDFDRRDAEPGAPAVAVVTAMAAERLWPGRAAVGQRVEVRATPEATPESLQVIGVVGDSLTGPPARPFEPHVYRYYRQVNARRLTLVVSADAALSGRLHEMLRARYPDLAVLDLQPFSEQLRRGLADHRLNADFASGLGALGLLLSIQGLYSLMAYTVARRTREIGLRKALGANAGVVARLVFAETGRLIAAGIVIGSIGAVAFARLLANRVAGVDASRPESLVLALVLLAACGLLAAALPALRAARIEPADSMRSL